MSQSSWSKIPFVRFLLPFLSGIITSILVPCSFLFCCTAFVLSFLLFLFAFFVLKSFRFALVNGLLLSAVFYFFGISLHLFQDELFRNDHFSKKASAGSLVLYIDEPVVEKTRSFRLHTKVVGCLDSTGVQQACSGNLLVYAAKDSLSSRLAYGDVLIIRKSTIREVPEPRNPDEFDYKRYLLFNNIHFQAYLAGGDYVKTACSRANALFQWVYSVQQYFKRTLATYVASPVETGVAEALLYGYDDEIDPEVIQAYANTGTLHVLAVSGMHVGLIFMILNMLLKFMDGTTRMKLLKNVVIGIGLWAYSLLCGLSPSIMRATVMFSCILLGQVVKRPGNIYNTLAVSAFFLVCSDTNTIANVGFQLSYAAVAGIVLLHPYVYEWLNARSWLGNEIWKITSVSIAAQAATFPLGLLYFHQFPNYFLLSNLVIIPLTTLIIYIGIVLIACSKITLLATWLGKLMYWGIAVTNYSVKQLEHMPFSYVNGIQVSIAQAICIFLCLAFVISYLLWRRTVHFKSALLVASVFCTLHGTQLVNNLSGKEMTVYSIRGSTAISIIQGEQALLLADSALFADTRKWQFHLQQHLWHHSVRIPQKSALTGAWQNITVAGKLILLSGEGMAAIRDTVDLLIITRPLDIDKLNIVPRQVVISGSVSASAAKRLTTLYTSRNIPCHPVGESGAFQLSLYQH
jgi:competence protein ComEC